MLGLEVTAPHIVAGVLVLVCFWATLLAPKGGLRHRRVGRTYLLLLLPLLASVLPISLHYAQGDPARIARLVYLSTVVASAGWTAWRAVKDRRAPERFRGPVFRALAVALTASGVALLGIGIGEWDVLTVGFSVIGIVYGGAMLGFLGTKPAADWWLTWHLNGVCLLFAATHASFIGLAARTLFPEQAGQEMHAATQLGTIAFAYGLRQWLGRRYGPIGRPGAESPAMRMA
jgi:hypothetical protein